MVNFDSPLWKRYTKACNDYLKKFCTKHGFDFDDAKDSWVANLTGGIVECADFFFSLEDIILDVETNTPEDEIIKWYDFSLKEYEETGHTINYYSWLNGYKGRN